MIFSQDAAAELLAHVLGHEPLPRHDIERLGDVLADLREPGAAAARAGVRCRVNDAPSRQVSREVPACRRPPHEALNLDTGRLCLGLVLAGRRGQFLELQLHLVEQPLAALGARAEELTLHLGDHQLKMLDQRHGAGQLGARFRQRRLQRIHVVGQRIRRVRHARMESRDAALVTLRSPTDSQCRVQPAACGRHVCCGSRQSMPSSRYPSCAGVIVTVRSVPSRGAVDGQTKRPRSSRLA